MIKQLLHGNLNPSKGAEKKWVSARNDGASVDVLFRRRLRVKELCYALAVEIRDGHQHDRADLRGRALL